MSAVVWTHHTEGRTEWYQWRGFKVRRDVPGQFWFLSDYDRPAGQRIIGNFNSADLAKSKAIGLAPKDDTYRGWTISYDPPPIPIRDQDGRATGPNYDASYEGPEDGWVDNGEKASAATREALIAEIDAWFEEHGQ